VRIVVTEVTGQGNIRRGVLDTADCSDADRCDDLIQRAALNVPPPYRPVVGRPVYEIYAGDKVIWVARRDLAGPLLELVMATLAGEHPRAAQGAAGASARDCLAGRREQQLPEAQPARGQRPGEPDVPEQPGAPDVPEQGVQAGGGS
jgi:hypothetical protein